MIIKSIEHVIFFEVENEFFSFFCERETVVVAYCDTCKVAICFGCWGSFQQRRIVTKPIFL